MSWPLKWEKHSACVPASVCVRCVLEDRLLYVSKNSFGAFVHQGINIMERLALKSFLRSQVANTGGQQHKELMHL